MLEPETVSISTQRARIGLQARHDLRRHFVNVPVPCLLFFAFIAMVLTHTPIHQVYLADHGVSSALNPKASDVVQSKTIVNFMKIRTMDDIPKWINNSVLPSVFTKTAVNGTILAPELQGRISMYNQLVGAVEFSIFNTRMTKCESDSLLAKRYGPCFDFHLEADIKEGDLATRNLRRQPWYTMYIPTAHPDPYARFKRWVDEGSAGGYFLSMATREFHVKITTYNGELDMFSYLHFQIHVEEGGAYTPTYSVQSVPTNPYSTSIINMILDIIVGIFVLAVLGRRLLTIKRQIFRQVAWHCDARTTFIEWCSILCVGLYYAAWIQICQKFFASHFEDELAKLTTFYDDLYKLPLAEQRIQMGKSNQPDVSDFIDTFGPSIQFLYVISIVTCLQLVVHVLAAFQFHPTMNILTNTIVASLKRLGAFLFIFLLVVMALATSGCLLFGPQLDEFSSLHKSMVTCINMLFGGYSYDMIKDYNDLAILWYWASQSIITLVLINIMLAVIIAAHEDVVTTNEGKRSFITEFIVVLHDVLSIYILQRPDLLGRLETILNQDVNGTTVWTAKQIAQAISVTDLQGEKAIKKLQAFAATAPSTERTVLPSKATLEAATLLAQVASMDAKVQDVDAKLAFIVELLRQQQQTAL
ncbi:hypothetical protein SPRG_09562 [Saprolegnia parasitica CBS 223.65]|uniref:Polycystin cation channel PKD1/PKD2 domain-containing protein n=1 Tax=Saprolegnia parasitica (strain CBS 223.65) TaxID=695850 RepID=A0A067C313_SAPPC|nr:hypothetical protein SPRG_09562 [Saprolegnia parasitica CBS 223.65]KDO24918.1 hypothetical protein SPRG_09562 [Saprolegnia parasitica CBS 223.65]|eukprot:XP_012204378.1 hypothetical protein SPRG_09562 [Saprolegnia parasitica CBS 223.65]